MNIKKRVLSAGLTFASALLLAACGQSGSDTKSLLINLWWKSNYI